MKTTSNVNIKVALPSTVATVEVGDVVWIKKDTRLNCMYVARDSDMIFMRVALGDLAGQEGHAPFINLNSGHLYFLDKDVPIKLANKITMDVNL